MGWSKRPFPDSAGPVAAGGRGSAGSSCRNLRISSQDAARGQQLDSFRRWTISRDPGVHRQRNRLRSPTVDSPDDGERPDLKRRRGRPFPVGGETRRGTGAPTPGPSPGFPPGRRPDPDRPGGTHSGQEQQRLSEKPGCHAGPAIATVGPLHGPSHRFRRRRRRPAFLPSHHGADSVCDPPVPGGSAAGWRGGGATGGLQSREPDPDPAPRRPASSRRRVSGPDDRDPPGSGPQPGPDRRGTPGGDPGTGGERRPGVGPADLGADHCQRPDRIIPGHRLFSLPGSPGPASGP